MRKYLHHHHPHLLLPKKKSYKPMPNEWIFSQELPSGITIQVGGTTFALRKDIFGRDRKKIELRQEHEKELFWKQLLLFCRGKECNVSQLSLNASNGSSISCDNFHRILTNYLDGKVYGSRSDDEYVSSLPNSMERVGKLMESYLAEITSDQNLTILSFITLAELVPEQAMVTEDGMFRAIDIYLKAHPSVSDVERKKVCSIMDCQKLSRKACAHAAQNERLPVQIVVQVLYYEQQHLQDSMTGRRVFCSVA